VEPQCIPKAAASLAESLREIMYFDAFLTIMAGVMIGSLASSKVSVWDSRQSWVT
jgi:hypothetical protein